MRGTFIGLFYGLFLLLFLSHVLHQLGSVVTKVLP